MNDLPLCECGCGNRVSKMKNRFILGHHTRVIEFEGDDDEIFS